MTFFHELHELFEDMALLKLKTELENALASRSAFSLNRRAEGELSLEEDAVQPRPSLPSKCVLLHV